VAQVGRPDRQTPTFRDQVEYLELNPTWTVPPTILKKDILPKARVNPGYVAKKGLKAIDRNGRTVPLSAVNWNHPAGSFPYTLRQDGGGQKAALGLMGPLHHGVLFVARVLHQLLVLLDQRAAHAAAGAAKVLTATALGPDVIRVA
jgi:hypothetical protein